MSAEQTLAEQVLKGDRRAVARAISMVEDGAPGLAELSAEIFPHTGKARTLGLTGAPGVGKSSLAEQLVRVARERDLAVAVLAIDPTSPFTGGALLGDRLRMQTHATDPKVFIRSMATRGHLGGIALAAPEAIRILDASGADVVIVETVGVGQVEVDIATAADTTMVIVQPGMGDSIQAAKAGILEIADVFVVNKSDRDGAKKAVQDLESMIAMAPPEGWVPPVVPASATAGEGIEDVWRAAEEHAVHLRVSGGLDQRRRARLLSEVEDMAGQRVRERLAGFLEGDEKLARSLTDRLIDPYAAADALTERVGRG